MRRWWNSPVTRGVEPTTNRLTADCSTTELLETARAPLFSTPSPAFILMRFLIRTLLRLGLLGRLLHLIGTRRLLPGLPLLMILILGPRFLILIGLRVLHHHWPRDPVELLLPQLQRISFGFSGCDFGLRLLLFTFPRGRRRIPLDYGSNWTLFSLAQVEDFRPIT